jgi:hypothetical protein
VQPTQQELARFWQALDGGRGTRGNVLWLPEARQGLDFGGGGALAQK